MVDLKVTMVILLFKVQMVVLLLLGPQINQRILLTIYSSLKQIPLVKKNGSKLMTVTNGLRVLEMVWVIEFLNKMEII